MGEIEEPGFLEGGDYFAAGEDLSLVGVGLRSNQEACDQLMQRNWLGTDRLAVVRDDFEQHQVSIWGAQQLKEITHGLKPMKVHLALSLVHLASDWHDHHYLFKAKARHPASRVLMYLPVTLASGMQANASCQNFT